MNYYKKKHNILKILSLDNDKIFDDSYLIVNGIKFEKILNILKINENELTIIIAELIDADEIKKTDDGLIIKNKGVSSFTNKKYLKNDTNYKVSLFKDIVQIVIPILTSIIAIIALSITNHKSLEERVKKVEEKLELQKTNQLK